METPQPNVLWRNVALVVAFFTLTPMVLLASLISLISMTPPQTKPEVKNTTYSSKVGISVYASLPATVPSVSGQITTGDARPEIVKRYLAEFDSPLLPYSEMIVQTADKYGIDYRFIPAIARQESNLCHIIPPGSYNCWGWGITSVSSLGFDSYTEAIDTVTKGLKTDYIDDGLVTPQEIMTKYTPQSNGSWASGVSEFMSEMR